MPKIIDDKTLMGEVLQEWSIAEYEKHERNKAWYFIMGILGLGFVIYGIWQDNYLFVLIIILFSIILFLQSHQEPIVVPFKITELGVVINNRFYQYSELDEFYIVYIPEETQMLFIETKSSIRPRLRIPLMDMNPNEVRMTLREFLSENTKKEDEPLSDMVGRKWKLH